MEEEQSSKITKPYRRRGYLARFFFCLSDNKMPKCEMLNVSYTDPCFPVSHNVNLKDTYALPNANESRLHAAPGKFCYAKVCNFQKLVLELPGDRNIDFCPNCYNNPKDEAEKTRVQQQIGGKAAGKFAPVLSSSNKTNAFPTENVPLNGKISRSNKVIKYRSK